MRPDIRRFPCHDDITIKLDRRLRDRLAARLEVSRRFMDGLNPADIAHDSDGDSLLVRGTAIDHSDVFFAIPAKPTKRVKPVLDGNNRMSLWFANESGCDQAPVVIAPDLKTTALAVDLGCSAAMLCVAPELERQDTRRDLLKEVIASGISRTIDRRLFKHSAIIIGSAKDSWFGPTEASVVAAGLRYIGYSRTILRCARVDLASFRDSSLDQLSQLLMFLDEIRHVARGPVVSFREVYRASRS